MWYNTLFKPVPKLALGLLPDLLRHSIGRVKAFDFGQLPTHIFNVPMLIVKEAHIREGDSRLFVQIPNVLHFTAVVNFNQAILKAVGQ